MRFGNNETALSYCFQRSVAAFIRRGCRKNHHVRVAKVLRHLIVHPRFCPLDVGDDGEFSRKVIPHPDETLDVRCVTEPQHPVSVAMRQDFIKLVRVRYDLGRPSTFLNFVGHDLGRTRHTVCDLQKLKVMWYVKMVIAEVGNDHTALR